MGTASVHAHLLALISDYKLVTIVNESMNGCQSLCISPAAAVCPGCTQPLAWSQMGKVPVPVTLNWTSSSKIHEWINGWIFKWTTLCMCVSCDCSPDCFSLGSVLGTRVGAVLYLTHYLWSVTPEGHHETSIFGHCYYLRLNEYFIITLATKSHSYIKLKIPVIIVVPWHID